MRLFTHVGPFYITLQAAIKFGILLMGVINIVMPILHIIYSIPDAQTVTDLLCHFIGWARYCFFRADTSTRLPDLADMDNLDTLLGTVVIFMIIFRQLFSFFADGLLLMVCLSLWGFAKALKNLIRAEMDSIERVFVVRDRSGKSITILFSVIVTL